MSNFSSRIDSAKLTVNKMYYFNNYQSHFQVQNSSEQSAEKNRNNNIRDFIVYADFEKKSCDNCSFDNIFDKTIIEVTETDKVASTRRIEDFGICLHSWRASLEHFLPVSSISC